MGKDNFRKSYLQVLHLEICISRKETSNHILKITIWKKKKKKKLMSRELETWQRQWKTCSNLTHSNIYGGSSIREEPSKLGWRVTQNLGPRIPTRKGYGGSQKKQEIWQSPKKRTGKPKGKLLLAIMIEICKHQCKNILPHLHQGSTKRVNDS